MFMCVHTGVADSEFQNGEVVVIDISCRGIPSVVSHSREFRSVQTDFRSLCGVRGPFLRLALQVQGVPVEVFPIDAVFAFQRVGSLVH